MIAMIGSGLRKSSGQDDTSWKWISFFALTGALEKFFSFFSLGNSFFAGLSPWFVTISVSSDLFLFEFARNNFNLKRNKKLGFWIYFAVMPWLLLFAFRESNVIDYSLRLIISFSAGILAFLSLRHDNRKCGHDLNRWHPILPYLFFLFPITRLEVSPNSFFLNSESAAKLKTFLEFMGGMNAFISLIIAFLLWRYFYNSNPLAGSRSILKRWQYIFIPGFIFTIFLTGWFTTDTIGKLSDTDRRNQLLMRAEAISYKIDPDYLSDLAYEESDWDKPTFKRLRNLLILSGRLNPDRRYIYLMAKKNDKVVFTVEDIPETDPDFEKPGGPYADVPPEVMTVFAEGRSLTVGPYTDQWGTFISAFVPVRGTGSSAVVSVLGMDILADKWDIDIFRKRRVVVLIVFVMISMFLIGVAAIIKREKNESNTTGLLRYVETVIVFSFLCAISMSLFLFIDYREKFTRRQNFERFAETKIAALEKTLKMISSEMAALSGLFRSDRSISANDFKEFVNSFNPENISGVSYAWVPLLANSEREKFEESIFGNNSGLSVFKFDSTGKALPVDIKNTYYPVRFIEPSSKFNALKGFDISSDKIMSRAIEEALQSMLFTATDPLTVPFGGKAYDEKGWLILNPIFLDDINKRSLEGFAAISISAPQLLESSFSQRDPRKGDIVARLIDLNSEDGSILMSTYGISRKNEGIPISFFFSHGSLKWIEPIFVFGRTWAIVCEPGETFYSTHPMFFQWMVLIAGGLITIILSVITYSLQNAQDKAEKEVHQRTSELMESEERFKGVYNSTYDALVLHDFEGRIVDVNATMMKMFGLSWEEARGLTLYELSGPDNDLSKIYHYYRKVMEDHIQVFEWQVKRATDGFLFDVEVALRKFVDAGKPLILACIRDITKSKHAEKALKESEERYRFLLDNAQFPVIITSLENRREVLFINKRAAEIFNIDVNEAVGEDPVKYWKSMEERSIFLEILTRDKLVNNFEAELKTISGKNIWALLSANVITFSGRPAAFTLFNDITDRKNMETALLESEQKYRSVVENIQDVFFRVDADDIFTMLSPSASRVLGYD